jgi:ribosomal protein S18 acetylase RimI-like enzyme
MQIKKANVNDAQEILAIQKLAFLGQAKIYNNYNIPTLLETLDELKEAFKTYTILKTAVDGKIVGSVRFLEKDGTCFIGRLLVDPEFQNRGVGTELLIQAENLCSARRLELFTGEQSTKTLNLYKKLGYRQFKTGKDPAGITIIYLEKLK